MAVDLALRWDNQNWRGDWRLEDRLLASDDDLGTSVMLSLFTDRTAQPGDDIPDQGPVRGWWADTYRPYAIGSRLWLLWREKKTEAVRRRAEEYTRESLDWMLDAEVARQVDVTARWLPHPDATGVLEITVTLYPPAGERRIWRFPIQWAEAAGLGR